MHKLIVFSVISSLFILNLLTSNAMSQDSHMESTQTAQSVDVKSKMHFLLHLPAGYHVDLDKNWPLLVFLHGAGERGDDLELVKKWGPPKMVEAKQDLPFVVVSPQCPTDVFWNIEHLSQLIDSVIKNNRVDQKRVYLTGLSMGGYGTWGLAQ